MMNDLISVIVPIYNVEKYLKKCIDSILNQTYSNLEIILVDDGSTDNCGKYCDDYQKMDSRIVVLHKKNGGLSDARNYGINIANGKYLILIDSDDYIHRRMIEYLYCNIIKYNADISFADFKRYKECEIIHSKEIEECNIEEMIWNSKDYLKNIYGSKSTQCITAWGKLYNIKLFDGIRYPVGKLREDEFTTYKLAHKANRIVYADVELYYYLTRENSIMAKSDTRKFIDYVQALFERNKFVSENYSELEKLDGEYCLKEIYSAYVESMILDQSCITDIKGCYDKIYDKYGKNKGILFKAMKYFPRFNVLLYKARRCI